MPIARFMAIQVVPIIPKRYGRIFRIVETDHVTDPGDAHLALCAYGTPTSRAKVKYGVTPGTGLLQGKGEHLSAIIDRRLMTSQIFGNRCQTAQDVKGAFLSNPAIQIVLDPVDRDSSR